MHLITPRELSSTSMDIPSLFTPRHLVMQCTTTLPITDSCTPLYKQFYNGDTTFQERR
nr:hypothetical protein Q903MT_gene5026 [Picea sitchensis]